MTSPVPASGWAFVLLIVLAPLLLVVGASLGLRVEYARFGRFAGELGATLPDTDQVSFGLQMRF